MFLVKDAQSLGDLDLAHERGQQWFAGVLLGYLDEFQGRRRGVAHGLRRENGEDAVASRILHEGRGRGRVAHGVGVAADVDRVAPGSESGQVRPEPLVGVRRELRQLAAQREQAIAGHHARSAGVGHDTESGTAWAGHARQDLRRVEHVFDLVHADDACAAKDGAVQRVVAGDGSGVRRGRQSTAREAAALHDDDRLGLGEVARCTHEVPRLVYGLDVQDDRARVWVGAEVVDEVAEVHVGHRAHADESREPDFVGCGPVEDRCAKSPRLAEEGDAPFGRRDMGEGHVEVAGGSDVAEAVGTDDPQAVRLGDGVDLVLELAALGSDLAKA